MSQKQILRDFKEVNQIKSPSPKKGFSTGTNFSDYYLDNLSLPKEYVNQNLCSLDHRDLPMSTISNFNTTGFEQLQGLLPEDNIKICKIKPPPPNITKYKIPPKGKCLANAKFSLNDFGKYGDLRDVFRKISPEKYGGKPQETEKSNRLTYLQYLKQERLKIRTRDGITAYKWIKGFHRNDTGNHKTANEIITEYGHHSKLTPVGLLTKFEDMVNMNLRHISKLITGNRREQHELLKLKEKDIRVDLCDINDNTMPSCEKYFSDPESLYCPSMSISSVNSNIDPKMLTLQKQKEEEYNEYIRKKVKILLPFRVISHEKDNPKPNEELIQEKLKRRCRSIENTPDLTLNSDFYSKNEMNSMSFGINSSRLDQSSTRFTRDSFPKIFKSKSPNPGIKPYKNAPADIREILQCVDEKKINIEKIKKICKKCEYDVIENGKDEEKNANVIKYMKNESPIERNANKFIASNEEHRNMLKKASWQVYSPKFDINKRYFIDSALLDQYRKKLFKDFKIAERKIMGIEGDRFREKHNMIKNDRYISKLLYYKRKSAK